MTVRINVTFPRTVDALTAPWATTVAGQAEWRTARRLAAPQSCGCEEEGHWVRWRAVPHQPDPAPDGVLDREVEGCFCCFWGPRGLHERLVRESADDRDIRVEHLDKHGRWAAFDMGKWA